MNELVPRDGEVLSGPVSKIDPSAALLKLEIDTQIATARQFPRPEDRRIASRITDRATFDEEIAQECLYALVRGQKKKGRENGPQAGNKPEERENKPIEGPSIRLAEIAAQAYGNCRIDARVIQVNRTERFVEAEGIFHDLENNMASRATVRRSIGGRYGLFSDDMIVVTGNAACAIAKRNAILAGIPKALYRQAYQEARRLVAGDAASLSVNRDKAIDSFSRFGVKAGQVLDALGLDHVDDITVDHIATLRGMYATVRSGEATVEEMFAPREAAAFDRVANPLADDQEPAKPIVDQARGHVAAVAQADTVIGAGGQVLKSRDGEAGGTVDPIPFARERGGQAFANRMQRKAIPPEYREEGRQAEAQAWLDGFDEKKAAAAAAKAVPAPDGEGSADGNA